MNTIITQRVIERFYTALDAIIEAKKIRGVKTYCDLYEIDRRNLCAQRKDFTRGWFQVSWLVPMVEVYKISPTWLLTGTGRMFT